MLKFLLVAALFAALVYTVMWSIERRRAGRSPGAGRRTPRPQPRQVAPDDDQDFLRWLDRKRRQEPPQQ